MNRDDIHNLYRWQFESGRRLDNSVPEGWLPAIAVLCAGVAELLKGGATQGFHWMDIKEKHGMLSVSYSAPHALTEAIDALVDRAEAACRQVE